VGSFDNFTYVSDIFFFDIRHTFHVFMPFVPWYGETIDSEIQVQYHGHHLQYAFVGIFLGNQGPLYP